MDMQRQVLQVVTQAKAASRKLAKATTDEKNRALKLMADGLRAQRATILAANAADVEGARAAKLSAPLVERLMLHDTRFEEMTASVEAVISLPDPVGEVLKQWRQPNGLQLSKVRVPIGVIGIIYESLPNVTSDCAALCLKSGNAVVLRGGQEAFQSNHAIASALQAAIEQTGLPSAAVSLIPTPDRAGVDAMLKLDSLIDLIIPRGGEALIRKVAEQSTIPVIKHAKGVCHVYVDDAADLAMAERIAVNAKCQRPATCNAMETLLVHQAVAAKFLPSVVKTLQQAGVEVRGCGKTQALVSGVAPATEEDWSTEYLELILSIRVVESLDAAMDHIARYGSSHSDAIVTANRDRATRFLKEVDSACVYVNASTRFTDGYQFGLGAEIGISTDKLHARGPMGLEELTTYKCTVSGDGQLRQ